MEETTEDGIMTAENDFEYYSNYGIDLEEKFAKSQRKSFAETHSPAVSSSDLEDWLKTEIDQTNWTDEQKEFWEAM